MFTVANTLVGAVATAILAVLAPLDVLPVPPAIAAPAVLYHVWFLLGHLALRRRRREGRPDVWPPPGV